ncbi:MAG: hypothetical protein AAFW73_09015 [Bacteroidota bacterium]
MKQLKLLTFLIGSLVPLLSAGQAPGYLGMRTTVGFTVSAFPATESPTQNNRGSNFFGDEGGGFGLNYEWELQLGYVLSRRKQLQLILGQYYTGVATSMSTFPRFQDPFSSLFNLDFHELFFRVNTRSVGLMMSSYGGKNGGIAPMGNRFFYGVKFSFLSSEIVDKRTTYSSPQSEMLGHEPLDLKQRLLIPTFFLGWGNDLFLSDHLILGFGIRFGLSLGNGLPLILNGDEEVSATDTQARYRNALGRRHLLHEVLRFDLGLKYLLF